MRFKSKQYSCKAQNLNITWATAPSRNALHRIWLLPANCRCDVHQALGLGSVHSLRGSQATQWSAEQAACTLLLDQQDQATWPFRESVSRQEIRHDKNIILSCGQAGKMWLTCQYTFREIGSHLNNQYAKSLSNDASILLEHSLCPQLCPIQVAANQS